MPLDFPNHPSLGQVFVSTGITWTYDGTKWVSVIPQDLTYLPTSGGTMSGPLTLAGNAVGPLQAVPLQQLNAAINGINATNYGVVADGATDNTAAMQAAINAVQTSVYEGVTKILILPVGRMITGPLTISGQITIEGSQSSGSILVLKTGSTAACVTIAPAGSAFPGGAPRGRIILKSFQIESQSGKTGPSTAHGISVPAGGVWTAHVTMNDVTIYGMPGDGLNGGSFNGLVDCYDCSIFNNNGNGVSCNSSADWHWYGGDIAVNGASGALLSGCVQFVFVGTNIYSNGTSNALLFGGPGLYNGNHQFTDCMFDRGNQAGLVYDIRGSGSAVFKGCTFGGCSVTTPGTYSDVLIGSAANSLAKFIGCFWSDNHANTPANPELWALEFQGTTQTVVVDGTNIYQGGVLRASTPAKVFITAPSVKPTVSGAKGSNAALASLMTALVVLGLITDTTTA